MNQKTILFWCEKVFDGADEAPLRIGHSKQTMTVKRGLNSAAMR
jgi:hypothetical protein